MAQTHATDCLAFVVRTGCTRGMVLGGQPVFPRALQHHARLGMCGLYISVKTCRIRAPMSTSATRSEPRSARTAMRSRWGFPLCFVEHDLLRPWSLPTSIRGPCWGTPLRRWLLDVLLVQRTEVQLTGLPMRGSSCCTPREPYLAPVTFLGVTTCMAQRRAFFSP